MLFTYTLLSESILQEMYQIGTWKETCPVPKERLVLVKFSYINFMGQICEDGEMVVLDAVAPQVLEIFKELLYLQFPLAQAKRIEHYQGNDEASMAQNNSSCFNCREITSGGLSSLHSYGVAIDINPLQNPCILFDPPLSPYSCAAKILPAQGAEYMNRLNLRPGMVTPSIIDVFKKHGFTVWGGQWNTLLDFHHFQPPRAVAQLLALMTPNDAKVFFPLYCQGLRILDHLPVDDTGLADYYCQNPKKFLAIFSTHSELLNLPFEQSYEELKKLWGV